MFTIALTYPMTINFFTKKNIMKVPFNRAVVEHYHYGEMTVELAKEATYNMQKPHYYSVDNSEWGVFDLDDLDLVEEY